jgi:three-Cys-motif partner protein
MLDEDGLPLDEVGAWAKEKHERLRKYVDITRGVRKRWVEGTGGATYIDLFSGAGRAVVRETEERIDGSPLVALKSALSGGAPFSEIYIADESEERCNACEARLAREGATPRVVIGKAESSARGIVRRLNYYGML